MVPILLVASGADTRASVAELYDPKLLHRTSAFEIFPTLLRAAGYDQNQLTDRFYHSLFDADAPRGERRFLSGNLFASAEPFDVLNPKLGSVAYWNPFTLPEWLPAE
jgi:hypothetical protein